MDQISVAHLRASAAFLFMITSLFFGCSGGPKQPVENAEDEEIEICRDLQEIQARGKLIALVGNSTSSYFLYRGRPMGYEYELLQSYAQFLKLDLEIVIPPNMDSLMEYLKSGKGDVIASSLTVTKERSKQISFCRHHNLTYQVLVQHKPAGWRKMTRDKLQRSLIRNPIDLIGKKVFVRKNTAYYQRLVNLSDEIGGDIIIEEADGSIETEGLIRMVAEGIIPYTVADENIALISSTFYPQLDVKTRVSFPQRIAWAVRKNAPELKGSIDAWIDAMRRKPEYNFIYNKYYKSLKAQKARLSSEYHSYTGGALSPYDSLIRQHAETLGWDWRFLAALIYRESRFDASSESWMGAKGLMQLIPETAKRFGVQNPSQVDSGLIAGTRYLAWLDKFWIDKVSDPGNRRKFVLASYNVGQGHVLDAIRLTEKYGGDASSWEDVSKYLLLKSKQKYYTDPVVRHGYCRGSEPVRYVRDILNLYRQYATLINSADSAIRDS